MAKLLTIDKEYIQFFNQLKEEIKNAQIRASVAVNHELIKLYWYLGKQIIEKQERTKWGSRLIQSLSKDLQNTFPGMKGFSIRNLERMRAFALLYPDLAIAAQAVPQLPWGHIVLLIQRVKDEKAREWYIHHAISEGWSRLTLDEKIKQELYERQGIGLAKASNYLQKLPSPQSALAHDMLKSPYNFDFLSLGDDAQEREIEKELSKHVTKFLLELGKGFAFLGTQVPIAVSDHEFYIDMLFYHLHLRCYVVIELKAKEFKPTDAGQLNFYLTAVDKQMKHKDDNPSIGILLCRSRDKILAEYALQDINKPIGVSEYKLSKILPKKLKTSLPSIEEIEAEFGDESVEED